MNIAGHDAKRFPTAPSRLLDISKLHMVSDLVRKSHSSLPTMVHYDQAADRPSSPRTATMRPFGFSQNRHRAAMRWSTRLGVYYVYVFAEEASSDGLVRWQVRPAVDMVRHPSLILRDQWQGSRSDRLGFWTYR